MQKNAAPTFPKGHDLGRLDSLVSWEGSHWPMQKVQAPALSCSGVGPGGRGLVTLREEPIELPTLPPWVERVLRAPRISTTLRFLSRIISTDLVAAP